jgi:hypothetical protein
VSELDKAKEQDDKRKQKGLVDSWPSEYVNRDHDRFFYIEPSDGWVMGLVPKYLKD